MRWLNTLDKHLVSGRYAVPFSPTDFVPTAVVAPLDTGNFDFVKVTGLNVADFFKAAGRSWPLPSSAALPSALLPSVSDTLALSPCPDPSAGFCRSSEGGCETSIALEG